MRESDLLDLVRSLAHPDHSVPVGPGDDCAVVLAGDSALLLTTDQLVEHRHVRHDTPTDLIARKAVARTLSDIAAMAGTPRWMLAAGTIPRDDPRALDLCLALHRWALHFRCPIVGGDLASHTGPLVLTCTAIGLPHPARGPVLRSGARPGDALYVTGRIGASLGPATGLGRHLTFDPRIEQAHALCDTLGDDLHAMIDISDGLGRDAARLAQASACRVEIDPRTIPLHPDAPDWRDAVATGEDYELLFAAPPHRVPTHAAGVPVTRVGSILPGSGCVARLPDGSAADLASAGWDH